MKVAVFLANGFEEIEALSPVDYLRRANQDVVTVAVPEKGIPFENIREKTVISSHNVPVIADITLADYFQSTKKELPDCVICPGGSVGAENLSLSKPLLSHLEDCWNNKKLVAAICASPAVVLGKTKILDGRKWTCYPGMESLAEEKQGYVDERVVTNGLLVTGRGPGASEEFAMELVKLIAGEEVAIKIHTGAQQR